MVRSVSLLGMVALWSLALFPTHNVEAAQLVNATLNNTGLCLEVANNNPDGTVVDAFTCNGTFAQQWNFERTIIQGSGTTSSEAFCLDVHDNGTANGTVVDIAECNGTTAQNWYYYYGELISLNGSAKCLTAGTGAPPVSLTIQSCSASASQLWAIRS
jgi:hypothetical protein